MGKFLYDIVTNFYYLAIPIAARFNTKAKKFVEGRRDLFKNLALSFQNNQSPVAWFHCASLGEFEQGRPVMEAFHEQHPSYKILLTFYSPSGYEVRKNYSGADYIFYLPLDYKTNAKKFLDIVRPEIACFVKYEFWYYYLQELHRRQIPTISFSAIFRSHQVFFKWYGGFFRRILHFFNHIFVQSEDSIRILHKIGIKKATISGDTRFDRVWQLCSNPQEIPLVKSFKNQQMLMVMGSTWPSDMDVLLPLINDEALELKYVIAPHNIDENEITSLEKNIRKTTIRYSKSESKDLSNYQVLIIDNMGMLSSIYQYADISYIGGAFRKALHNTLEAATYGVPVLFGEDETNRKFREAIELQRVGGARSVRNISELKEAVNSLMSSDTELKEMGTKAASFVKQNLGATQIIINHLNKVMKE